MSTVEPDRDDRDHEARQALPRADMTHLTAPGLDKLRRRLQPLEFGHTPACFAARAVKSEGCEACATLQPSVQPPRDCSR